MPSSGMLHRVPFVRTDVSEELSASIIRVTRIGELRTLAVTSNRRTDSCHPDDGGVKFLRNVALTRATRRNIPVRTSQETHYFSATEASPLMLCKI
jgi:hypothetical protein